MCSAATDNERIESTQRAYLAEALGSAGAVDGAVVGLERLDEPGDEVGKVFFAHALDHRPKRLGRDLPDGGIGIHKHLGVQTTPVSNKINGLYAELQVVTCLRPGRIWARYGSRSF